MVTWSASSILAALSPAARTAVIPREEGKATMEAILRGLRPGMSLGAYLAKSTSAPVASRLVDRVIAALLLAGVVEHGRKELGVFVVRCGGVSGWRRGVDASMS